jgi:hypothetical protein
MADDNDSYDPGQPVSVLGDTGFDPGWSLTGPGNGQPGVLGDALNPQPWTPADNSLNVFVGPDTMKTIDFGGTDQPQPPQPDDGGFYGGLTPWQPDSSAEMAAPDYPSAPMATPSLPLWPHDGYDAFGHAEPERGGRRWPTGAVSRSEHGMIPKMCAAIIITFPLAWLTTMAVADPLSTYDDGMNALLTLNECKADFSEFSFKSSSTELKLRAMGDAAWRQLLAPLDEQDSAHHDENGHEADRELKQRAVADLAHVRDLVSSKGCDALVPHARTVLKG